ncbi:T-cell surface glycoprotein CD3 gamma chain-like [Pagrus major]|uniref:T-cell surface glycoprotein CD3 gamma chain-like n=1 Tax=Pagrus major TaxID=143350 RepID=UPI003CC8B36B
MKCQSILPACLLLLWTLTVFVSCQEDAEIIVKTVSDGIVLQCKGKKMRSEKDTAVESIPLGYKDDNTGEYTCVNDDNSDTDLPKIYVKFRSCDNCIELDEGSIIGLAIGNLVATIVIGVAVYLVVSQTRISPNTSHKKSSDRQHLVSNEMPRGTNDHYQPLNTRTVQGGQYDVLHKRGAIEGR